MKTAKAIDKSSKHNAYVTTICPFVVNPMVECYCIIVGSNNIRLEKALYYCGDNFTQCTFYKQKCEK